MNARTVAGATVGLVAGVGVVAGTAALVESSTAAPRFSMRGSRFDQKTFAGRFSLMLSNMDPSTLIASDAEIRKAEQHLAEFERGESKLSDAELWKCKKLVASAVHPDTKEIVPVPFRMSGYVPTNGPVCFAMMVVQSTPGLLFWNFVNQSQNAAVNFFNRNASSSTTNAIIAQSYATAVGAALTVAFGVSTLIKRSFDANTARRLLTFVALPSSMIASSANAYIMRSPELKTGIAVVDAQGKEIAPGARSVRAATQAVNETAMSRVLLQLPTFFVPPVFMMLPPIAAASAASPVVGITANMFITLVGFGLGLPAAVAYFPQIGELKVDEVEEPIRAAAKARGLQTVFYNKGL